MRTFQRETVEINASSMADIAFLLLIFFLVTTTVATDWGLQSVLPPIDIGPPKLTEDRDILTVLINAKNQLMVQGEEMPIEALRVKAREFIANPNHSPNLPGFQLQSIPLLGSVEVSKQVISLQNDDRTSYARYIQVRNELMAAYRDLRNDFALHHFGESFDELCQSAGQNEQKIQAVLAVYKQNISESNPKITVR